MKSKKFLIVSLILLAILTIGAVSASEDIASDDDDAVLSASDDKISEDTLTVSDEGADIEKASIDDVPSDNVLESSNNVSSADVLEMTCDKDDSIQANDEESIDDEVILTEGEDDNKENIDYVDWVSDNYVKDKSSKFGIGILDYDARGNVIISIDNNEIYNESVEYYDRMDETGGNYIYLDGLVLSFGSHDYKIEYTGDENYYGKNITGAFNFTFKEIFVSDEIIQGVYNYIEINLPVDATGNIKVVMDNELFYNASVSEIFEDSPGYIYVPLDNLTIGTHEYLINYTGGNYDDFTESGSFNVTYYFDVEFPGNIIFVGDEVTIKVALPDDASSVPIATLGGKSYAFTKDDNDWFVLTLSDFAIGENPVVVSYQDEKYPLKTYEGNIYLDYIFNVPTEVSYNSEDAIYLRLPSNASGNLVVVINESEKKVKLVDGIARFFFNGYGMGDYLVSASYDGTDYLIAQYNYPIHIGPNVKVPKYIWINGNYNITVESPEDSDSNITVSLYKSDDPDDYDSYSEFISKLYDGPAAGIVNIPLDFSVLEGDQWYKIEVALDGGEPSSHYMQVKTQSPYFDLSFSLPQELMIYNYGEFGYYETIHDFYQNDASGILTFYLDGKIFSNATFDGYTATLNVDYSKFSYGPHSWRLTFTNDSYYYDNFTEGTIDIGWYSIPDVVQKGSDFDDNDVVVWIGQDKNAVVTVLIDNKEFAADFVNRGQFSASLSDLAFGVHNYTILVDGDEHLSASGNFTVKSYLKININNEYEGNISYAESIRFLAYVASDATGNLTFVIDNQDPLTVDIKDGCAFIDALNLTYGEHFVVVNYSGDDTYLPSSENMTFNVTDYAVYVESRDIESWNMRKYVEYVSLRLPENAEGSLVITEGDSQIKSVPLVNGYAKISLDDLTGIHDLFVYYSGADYNVRAISLYLGPEFNYGISDCVAIGKEINVYVFIENANGNLIVYFDDEKIANQTFNSSIVNVSFVADKFGLHRIKFEYEGSDYPDILKTYDVMSGQYISYILEELYVAPIREDIQNTPRTVHLELPDDANGYLEVYVDMELHKNETVSGSDVSVLLGDLQQGYHYIGFRYVDGKYGVYDQKDYNYKIHVAAEPEISVETPKEDVPTIIVKINGNATGSLYISVGGNKYTQKLNNSMARFEIPGLAIGNYNITIVYSGDDKYSRAVINRSVVIESKNQGPSPDSGNGTGNSTPAPGHTPAPIKVPAKIVAKNYSAYYNKGIYSVTVYGTDGKVAKGVTVVFKINGKKVATAKTNAKGVAKFNVKQVPKTYKVTATALGKSVTKKLTVKQVLALKKVTVKRSAKKLVITAILKEGKKALKGKKIIFRFNGKKYTAKTNKKGIAKITIKKSVLKKLKAGKTVKYQAIYLKDTVKRSVKVQK